MVISKKVNPNNKYFKTIVVHGRLVEAYVDLGSSVSTMVGSLRKGLALVLYDDNKGYDEGTVQSLGKTEPVNVRIDEYETVLTFCRI